MAGLNKFSLEKKYEKLIFEINFFTNYKSLKFYQTGPWLVGRKVLSFLAAAFFRTKVLNFRQNSKKIRF